MTNDLRSTDLPDIQNTPDERGIAIDKVGVRGVKHPIRVLDRADEVQSTIGDFELTVNLPASVKGTHMSRFLEVLNDHSREVSVHSIPKILVELREKLKATESQLEVRFPYFMSKPAPVTGKTGLMQFDCGFRAKSGAIDRFEMLITASIATLCPCSKEISKYGAHNQRGIVTVSVETNDHVWLEEIIEMIERGASVPLFPVLKRPDEKWVTEHAYENPRFVEDVVREVARQFLDDPRIDAFTLEVENQESIHAHNAYASITRDKRSQ